MFLDNTCHLRGGANGDSEPGLDELKEFVGKAMKGIEVEGFEKMYSYIEGIEGPRKNSHGDGGEKMDVCPASSQTLQMVEIS
jgi:hypothetical protein